MRLKHSILAVDDEPAQRLLLSQTLSKEYTVVAAADASEAIQLLERRSFDLVITDQRMPGMSGIELIRWIRDRIPEMPIVVLTAHGSVETAVEAMKAGAQEYLTKPLKSLEELRHVTAKAIRGRKLQDQVLVHAEETNAAFPPDIVAKSDSIRKVLMLAAQVAPQPATVLLTGESGTGKEIVARFIHRSSPRVENPFVPVNCAALTETILESELFGHEKGAFTGAIQTRRGRFELAQGGSLFLDEVGELGLNIQAKLLRVLQEQQFERVGGMRTIMVDVRVIAATNKDLDKALEEKSFREDLFYRLNVFPIHIPPLRERREDILPLADFFIGRISSRMGRAPATLTAEARDLLLAHDWPGNVREMQNALERALIVARGDSLLPADLPLRMGSVTLTPGHGLTLAEIEKRAILDALSRHKGERRATAEELKISLRTLQYRLKEYGMLDRV
jgi:DNA-binding NtrC family response regulator